MKLTEAQKEQLIRHTEQLHRQAFDLEMQHIAKKDVWLTHPSGEAVRAAGIEAGEQAKRLRQQIQRNLSLVNRH